MPAVARRLPSSLNATSQTYVGCKKFFDNGTRVAAAPSQGGGPVARFQLQPHQRRVLSHIVGSVPTAKELTRAQALLWLDEGEGVEEVAHRLLVSRQPVDNWLLRVRQRAGQEPRARLQDAPRGGRPPTAKGIIDPLLKEVIDTDPREHGYRHTVWTAALLQHYLRQVHGIAVSRRSIGLAIARLGIRWKRPRHVLGQRPETWKQAKGG